MSVSIIIPTLNEASCLAETLNSLKQQQPHEIIVVDGGSQDATCEIAGAADLLLHSPPGRARQMNTGGGLATGDILVFLHADCELESGALRAVEKCLHSQHVVAGCLTMRVRAQGWLYRWIDIWATARVRMTGMAYGDQGLFLSRQLFQRLGGFPELRFMEDVFFSRALRRHGRIAVVPSRIFVSARRWQRTGLFRQTLRNWTLTGLVAGGVHPDRLARFYPTMR
jgi:rSAM/selenodomain-associated transferase 2